MASNAKPSMDKGELAIGINSYSQEVGGQLCITSVAGKPH